MTPAPEPMPAAGPVLVLGIGNLLWADEGFGVRCIEQLNRTHVMAPGVMLMDGGTQGLYLLHHVQAARRLIVFDAIDYGLPPGTLKLVRDDDVPCFTGVRKMSLHQTGFQDVLSAASLLGATPEAMLLIGVQAGELEDWGGSLTAVVRAQLDPAVAIALDQLAAWGVPATARPTASGTALLGPGLDIVAYETGRPDAATACRDRDDRFYRG
ncbi:MAG: HyaD/HybD family hydrogenase maturation endopeptidase [Azospirillaceae bacterium]|nr:HyaD/HybD family hydrogenase maturation endopeptidase [Azospirillaceae bacterium]